MYVNITGSSNNKDVYIYQTGDRLKKRQCMMGFMQ